MCNCLDTWQQYHIFSLYFPQQMQMQTSHYKVPAIVNGIWGKPIWYRRQIDITTYQLLFFLSDTSLCLFSDGMYVFVCHRTGTNLNSLRLKSSLRLNKEMLLFIMRNISSIMIWTWIPLGWWLLYIIFEWETLLLILYCCVVVAYIYTI